MFKIIYAFRTRFNGGAKQKDPKVRLTALDYCVKIFDGVHFRLPQLHLKEILIGFAASKIMLLYPKNSQLVDTGNDERKMIALRGFNITPNGKRQPIEATIVNVTYIAVCFFSMHIHDSYLGRMVPFLATIMSLWHTQMQAHVILIMLEVCGDKLLQVYGRAFVKQLVQLRQHFCPSFKTYFENKEMEKEPQNKAEYLIDGDTGIPEMIKQFDKLINRVGELLD